MSISPRLPSAITSKPRSRARSHTSASAAQPAVPSRSKQASCNLTATQCSATASRDRDRARGRAGWRALRPRPAGGRRSSVDGLLEPGPGGELRHAGSGDLDLLAGRGVAAFARGALRDAELAKAGEDDVAAAPERVLDRFKHRVNRVCRVLLAQPGAIGYLVDEFGLRHLPSFEMCGSARS